MIHSLVQKKLLNWIPSNNDVEIANMPRHIFLKVLYKVRLSVCSSELSMGSKILESGDRPNFLISAMVDISAIFLRIS